MFCDCSALEISTDKKFIFQTQLVWIRSPNSFSSDSTLFTGDISDMIAHRSSIDDDLRDEKQSADQDFNH